LDDRQTGHLPEVAEIGGSHAITKFERADAHYPSRRRLWRTGRLSFSITVSTPARTRFDLARVYTRDCRALPPLVLEKRCGVTDGDAKIGATEATHNREGYPNHAALTI
jgi:hypothetical protein